MNDLSVTGAQPALRRQWRHRSVGPHWNDERETRPVGFQDAAQHVAGHGTVLKADAGGSNPQPGSPFRAAGHGDGTSRAGYQAG
jgi:hypothetical protein